MRNPEYPFTDASIEALEPVFTRLINDSLSVPQVGQAGEITVVNGGYEDE